LAALATDLIASSISRPSASKLSMMDIVDREADAEQPRGSLDDVGELRLRKVSKFSMTASASCFNV